MSDVHMQAMQLDKPRQPWQLRELPVPIPAAGQLLIRVSVCGVCRTDLHIADGDLTQCRYPWATKIVGRVVQAGPGVEGFAAGQRVGVPWLGYACGQCRHCLAGRENLCEERASPVATSPATCAVRRRRCTLQLPAAGGLLGRTSGAPVVCWLDRIPVSDHGGRRAQAGHLRIRRSGAYCRAGGAVPGPRNLCVFAAGRSGRLSSSRATWVPRLGRRLFAAAAGGVGRRHHFCAGRRAGARCSFSDSNRRHGRMRRNSRGRTSTGRFPTNSCGAKGPICSQWPI